MMCMVATLNCPEMGHCMSEVKSWLKAGCWKVLQKVRGTSTREPAWDVNWRTISGLLEGRAPALLRPVALGTRCKGKLTKSAIAGCDVARLLAPLPFDLRWTKAVNGRLPSSISLDPSAQHGPCPCRLVCEDCQCPSLDTPQHLFEDDGDCCDLMDGSAAFLQLSASLWFRHGAPLLSWARL